MQQNAAAALVSIALMGDRTDLAQLLRPDPDIANVSWSTACYEIGGLVPSAVRDFSDPIEAIGALVACPEPGHVVAELVASTDAGLRWIAMTRNDRQLAFRLPDPDTATDLSGAGSADLTGALRRWRQRLEMWSTVRGASVAPEPSDEPVSPPVPLDVTSRVAAGGQRDLAPQGGGWAAAAPRSASDGVAPEWFRMLELRLASVEQSLVASRLAGLESALTELAHEVHSGGGPVDLTRAWPGAGRAPAAWSADPLHVDPLAHPASFPDGSMADWSAAIGSIGPPPEVAPPAGLPLGASVDDPSPLGAAAGDVASPACEPALPVSVEAEEPETIAVVHVEEIGRLIDRVVADAIDHTVEHTGIAIGDTQEISVEDLEVELRHEMALAWEALVTFASGAQPDAAEDTYEAGTYDAGTSEAGPYEAGTDGIGEGGSYEVDVVSAPRAPDATSVVDRFQDLGDSAYWPTMDPDDLLAPGDRAPVDDVLMARRSWPTEGLRDEGLDEHRVAAWPAPSVATLVEDAPHLPDEVELMARTEVLRRAEWAVLADDDARVAPVADEAWMEWMAWAEEAEPTGRQAAIELQDSPVGERTTHPGRLIALVSALVLAVGAAGFALYHYVPAIGSLG